MKNKISLIVLFLSCCAPALSHAGVWQLVAARPAPTGQRVPKTYMSFRADEHELRSRLSAAAKGGSGATIELPMPDGSFRVFRTRYTPILPPELAVKYPEIQTYTAVAIDNPAVTAKLDFTVFGFHAMVFDGINTSFVDPANNEHDGYYTAHYKRDEVRADEGAGCVALNEAATLETALRTAGKPQQRVLSGYELRRYRLALSCTHQYAAAVTGKAAPTKAEVLGKMTTTINRVNGIYEREVSVTMTFASNEDTLIFTSAATDLLGEFNSSASSLLDTNQKLCDRFIGDANYDLGHAFSTGAGGLSSVGIICKTGSKAQCVTGSETPFGDGFDVDYVAHEMGHEYGSDHTFNNNQSGGCYANGIAARAYEPGSGSTIMAYAGLCSPDNVQPNSDDYFHSATLRQIQNYISTGGNVCAVKVPTDNKPPGLPAFTATYFVPARTPFELTAPTAIDSTGDSMITYCWEQYDLGGYGLTLTSTTIAGPLFRSYPPSKSPVRTFPNIKLLRSGQLSNAGVDKASGEKIPEVSRVLTFKLSARSLHNSYGCFVLPDDSIQLNVINGGTGFTVTSQSTPDITYQGFSTQKVEWNVANTKDAPISAANVDIYLSLDSGYTWPHHLGTFPNNGSASITLPNPETNVAAARIKVKGANNVFFNINSKDFRIDRNFDGSVRVYPIPASSILHVVSDNTAAVQAEVYNMVGRVEWKGTINGQADLPVYRWARGVYIMKLIDSENRKTIRKIVVQ